jgi:hypothetical protein
VGIRVMKSRQNTDFVKMTGSVTPLVVPCELPMPGQRSHDFHPVAETAKDSVLVCTRCGRAIYVELRPGNDCKD